MSLDLRDALLAASEHGTDRLSVEADRRLRLRLGLETAPPPARRVWLRPVLAVGAFAAVAAVAVVILQTRSSPSARVATAGLVDISQAPWTGTLTADALDVRPISTKSATVTWLDATIVAAPGTRLATRTDQSLALAQGAIQIQRSQTTPLVIDVPMGRVVFAAHRSSLAIERASVTILIDDGTGHFTDAGGQTHPLVAGVPLTSSPRVDEEHTAPAAGSSAPIDAPPPTPAQPPRPRRPATMSPDTNPIAPTASGPPGLTVPRLPDVPCTYKSDCDPGATCRKNEDGKSVCMGNGAAGAACWFDNDCLSNRCDQRRCTSAP